MLETYEYLKIISASIIVLIFLYAIFYYVKNYFSKNALLFVEKNREIEVVDRRIIGKNSILLLVKIKDRFFLLSSDESGTKLLYKFDEKEEQ